MMIMYFVIQSVTLAYQQIQNSDSEGKNSQTESENHINSKTGLKPKGKFKGIEEHKYQKKKKKLSQGRPKIGW